jgi:hypothetical protein
MAGTLFRFTGFCLGLRISCCIVGIVCLFFQIHAGEKCAQFIQRRMRRLPPRF